MSPSPGMHAHPTSTARLGLTAAFLALAALLVVLPHGSMAPMGEMRWDPVARTHVFVHDHGRMVAHGLANAAGTFAVLFTAASLALAYAKRAWAVRLHRWLGLPIVVLAGLHTIVYLADGSTRGWMPGTLAFAFFAGHGLTAAMKRRLLAAWGPGWWRLANTGSGWAALAMVVEHVLLASWHYGFARWFDDGHV